MRACELQDKTGLETLARTERKLPVLGPGKGQMS